MATRSRISRPPLFEDNDDQVGGGPIAVSSEVHRLQANRPHERQQRNRQKLVAVDPQIEFEQEISQPPAINESGWVASVKQPQQSETNHVRVKPAKFVSAPAPAPPIRREPSAV